jgi:NADH:ubiquinone oxidoreductase subunit
MIVGGPKGHMYNDSSWFNQDVQTVPYNKDLSNRDWVKLHHEIISNNR